ncbi:TonB-dependent receptor plug domain-containing protein [Loktanella sp. M215]|uniref:TonB-dependent receptor plug domain-containing protein n=1 Tax=Loktanella sp. M215 TaxID=2675431 RepID=UPI001F42B40D|nr:TonB-dependent receptor [Loktanella sp. M215]MCF7699201.1 TonB-dependent receptor [Loktanella sp. M215]
MLRSVLLASVALTPFTSATAQDAFALDEIIVTGGLSPIAAGALGRAASVVTADDIAARGIATVQDALRALPGVSVTGSGPTYTQVRIRGGEASHTLILIDGIAAAGGDGEYILSGLETANIEKIEVLRGPQSVYYGSDASAGVINIITRKGQVGTTLSGSLEVGAANTATAFLSHRTDRGGLSLALSHVQDDGFDQSGDGGERDGMDRTTAILSGDYLATDALKLGFTLRRSEQDYDTDAADYTALDAAGSIVDDPTLFSTRDETTGGIFAELDTLGRRLTHRLSYERTDNTAAYESGTPIRTERDALKYRLSYGLDGLAVAETRHLLNVLVEHKNDSSRSNPLYARAATSLALEYRGSFDNGLDVQAGARFDANDTFEDAATWNVGLSYPVGQSGARLHASAGVGIVNPSYFELYATDFGYVGNPALTPERNTSFDVGVTLPVLDGRGTLDVTYFNEVLTDEITDVATGAGTFSFVNQSGDSNRQGIELTGTLQATDTLALRMAYTYLDATNPDGSVEQRRPRNTLTVGGTLDTFGGRGLVSADVRHVSGNYDAQFFGAYETAKLPAYTTVDVAAQYDLTARVTLTGRVTNLFDDPAVDVWGYATRGRAGYVGVNARF